MALLMVYDMVMDINDMDIKAIMCDIDGTLVGSRGIVTPKTVAALRQARGQGFLFGLATGRDVRSVRDLLAAWGIGGLVDAIVGSGGAEICDLTLGVERKSFPLDGALIRQIMDHYAGLPVAFAVPDEGVLYTDKKSMAIAMLSKVDRIPYRVVDFYVFLRQPRTKLIIVTDPAGMDAVVARAATFHSDRYKSASLKTAAVLYEFMDPRVSKTQGLSQVMALHGWAMDQLLCFGDADNDYDMIVAAGCGVAMANGSAKVKAAADFVTADCEHDGIAAFLQARLLDAKSAR